MRLLFSLFFTTLTLSGIASSGRKITRQEYIDTYKEIAMREMQRSNIPASITLAQGILESGNGNSTLARKANNHFGIKCHDWKGKSIKHDDDARNECFRKYKSVEESFFDHSDFLSGRSRYATLFELEITDYKGWARGLKKAGYATSPTYAKALIRLIEEHNLQQYDQQVLAQKEGNKKGKSNIDEVHYAGSRKIHYNNRAKLVLAREGDNFEELSEELDLFQWQLPKYNDLSSTYIFSEGERVYLQPKRNKAEMGSKEHIVEQGESLHSISQRYAIKLDKLAMRNNMNPEAELQPGTIILLRGKVKGGSKLIVDNSASNDEGQRIKLPSIHDEEQDIDDAFEVEFSPDN